jgi:hypothetical protein
VPALADSVEQIVRSIKEAGEPVTGVEVAGQRPEQSEERSWITYWHPANPAADDQVGGSVWNSEGVKSPRHATADR